MRDSGVNDGGTDPGPGPGASRGGPVGSGALGGGGSRGGGALGSAGGSPQIARYPEAVKRALGLKSSPGWAVPAAILPVWAINGAGRPEEDFLRGERRFQSSIQQAAVAAQFGFARIENPNSGQLVVVERVTHFSPAGAGAQFSVATSKALGVGAAGGDTRATDGRIGGQSNSGVDVRSGTRGALLAVGNRFSLDGQAFRDVPFVAVLPGGWSLEVEHVTANIQINSGFVYRVVSIDPSELTGATP